MSPCLSLHRKDRGRDRESERRNQKGGSRKNAESEAGKRKTAETERTSLLKNSRLAKSGPTPWWAVLLSGAGPDRTGSRVPGGGGPGPMRRGLAGLRAGMPGRGR